MKNLLHHSVNRYRRRDKAVLKHYGSIGDETCGAFDVDGFLVIASCDGGWDHVSVSGHGLDRCPSWEEMQKIKHLFFQPHETAIEFHVPPAQHINVHPYCLHLWRPQSFELPLPPGWMVGPERPKPSILKIR